MLFSRKYTGITVFWDVESSMHGCMWLDYYRRAMRLTTEGCPLVSLQHVLLPAPPPGYVEGQIASMARRTGQHALIAASLNQLR